MHKTFLFFTFITLHSTTIFAMEVVNNNQCNPREIPSLYNICLDYIGTGFGNDSTEKYKNAFQNLATLYQIHREGKFKHIPYGIGSDEIKRAEDKIFPKACAKKVYTNIGTPFLVKHDNETVYIQDDMANIALLNTTTGEKHTIFTGNSVIHCCVKN